MRPPSTAVVSEVPALNGWPGKTQNTDTTGATSLSRTSAVTEALLPGMYLYWPALAGTDRVIVPSSSSLLSSSVRTEMRLLVSPAARVTFRVKGVSVNATSVGVTGSSGMFGSGGGYTSTVPDRKSPVWSKDRDTGIAPLSRVLVTMNSALPPSAKPDVVRVTSTITGLAAMTDRALSGAAFPLP